MFDWFFRKKEVEEIKNETKKGFDSVKKDIDHVGEWIKHLNSEKDFHKKDIKDLKEILSTPHTRNHRRDNTLTDRFLFSILWS